MKYSLGSLIFLKRSLVFPILGGSWEELPYVQGKEQWLCFAGAAMNRDPTSKVRETQVSTESAYLSRHWERASEGRQTETTIRDNRSIWSHGPQPCLTHETKPCCVVPPKMGGSWWRGLTECGLLEKARVNIDILGISELKWTGMGEFNLDDHYI